MLKSLNIICGTITILVGIFFRRLYFLIPMLHNVTVHLPMLPANTFYLPYPFIIYCAYYFITLFYVILGMTIIYSTFNYRHTILKKITILTALTGIFSSSFYIFCIIHWGNMPPSMTISPYQSYDKLSGFINSLIPTIVPDRFPNTCVTIAQLILVFAIVIIAVLKILNRPKNIIKRNILAGLIAFIVLVFLFLSRFYVFFVTISSRPYYFDLYMIPKSLIISFIVSSFSCICVAYCVYRILAVPTKLKAKNG